MKRYKISRIRPEINIEEAGKMADFDHLVKSHNASSGVNLNYWRVARGSAIVAAVVSLMYFAIVSDSYELGKKIPVISANEVPVELAGPELSDAELAMDDLEPEEDLSTEVIVENQVSQEVQSESNSQEEQLVAADKENQTGYIEAAPVDGFPALYQYFDNNLVYPDEILDEGVQGSVVVRFDIDTSGVPANIMIEKSLHNKLDSTAVVLIGKMPLWNPAMLYGRPILSTHRIPLFFKIDESAN